MSLNLFSTASSLLTGGASGGVSQASDLLTGDSGGGSSAQAGDFYGGSLNITKEDTTIKYALIIGGIIFALAIFSKKKGGK